MANQMPIRSTLLISLTVLALVVTSMIYLQAQDNATATTVPVRMTITASPVGDKPAPDLSAADVMVKQDKDRLKVTDLIPARGDRAGLELFVLVDDACDTSLGSQLSDLRTFIAAQPPSTSVGVGYMSNATVQIVQNFTTDHDQAAKALRLPLGNPGAFGSPYLSVIDLMKRWPAHPNRREVIMITDGIDRARRNRGSHFPTLNPDVDTASDVAQRTGTIIYGLYSPGIGFMRRSYWQANTAQFDLSRLAEETGGESYYLGLQSPVSFKPYLDTIQKRLDNQYILGFLAKPKKKAGLQSVQISTEVPGVEIMSANSVWVPAAK
jgi:hypothetical protein